MTNALKLKRIVKFALFGTIGFGAGGAVAGGIQQAISSPSEIFSPVVLFITIPVWGAIGGISLGLALRRKAVTLAFLNAIGLMAGGLIGSLFLLVAKPLGEVAWIAWFGVASIVIAWFLAFGIWREWLNLRKTLVLALAGLLGFGLSAYIIGQTSYFDNPVDSFALMGWNGLIWMWVGIIGGAFLGAALGFLEKEKTS